MKKIFYLLIGIIFLSSCASKEDKIKKLIKEDLYKTLYDFDSYQPIETNIEEAYQTPENDSVLFNIAGEIVVSNDLKWSYAQKALDALDNAYMWGKPNYYTSSYSDSQYYKYKEEAESNKNMAISFNTVIDNLKEEYQERYEELDDKKFLGYSVTHKFRCKTKGGLSTIITYKYIINPDINKVIWGYDMEEDAIIKTLNYLKTGELVTYDLK